MIYIKEIFYNKMYLKGFLETIYMVGISTFFAYIFGIIFASVLFILDNSKKKYLNILGSIFGWFINIGRSIPFLILAMLLINVTRMVVGTSIGSTASIVPLVIGSIPMVTRVIESSFDEVGKGKIETAQSMGAGSITIVRKVLIKESLPSIVRGLAISTISILGYTAMAGALGGGGLGQIAMSYGYQRYQTDVLISTLIILVFLVQVIQSTFNFTADLIDRRK